MNFPAKLFIGATVLVGCAVAAQISALAADAQQSADQPQATQAQDPHGTPSGGHAISSGGHGQISSGGHGQMPSFHGQMPSQNFRGMPPGYHGPSQGGQRAQPSTGVRGVRAPNMTGAFHGHSFAEFTSQEKEAWTHGSWRHTWHHHHFGWWWFADGFWFFYPEPLYPYPDYVGPEYYYEEGADYYWYWCDDPPGYYPYVQQCNDDWQPVPPTPQ